MDIRMPRLGVNDDEVMLAQWLIENNSIVEEGQEIAYIESSKTSGEIKAPARGSIHLLVHDGQEVSVGAIVATMGGDAKPATRKEPNIANGKLLLTERAQKLVDEYKIDTTALPHKNIIRENDILQLIQNKNGQQEIHSTSLLILGVCGFTKIAIDILRTSKQYEISGIIDVTSQTQKQVMGIPLVGKIAQLKKFYEEGHRNVFNAFSDIQGTGRKPTYNMAKKIGYSFPNIIHANATIESSVKLGEGNLICANSFIGSEATIGNNCIINVGSTISHDVVLGDHSNIASGATIAGDVKIGENTLIGQNVSVYMGVKIGNNVTIQNGCSIFKNVPDNSVVCFDGKIK